MSKLTISAVLMALRLAIKFVSRVSRLIYTVIDLVDDGCINASAPRPEWISTLLAVCDSLESLGGQLVGVENSIEE